MRKLDRVIGAGEFYFKKEGETDFTLIGETQGGSISTSVEKKEAWSKSETMKKLLDMAVTSVDATIKFETQKLSKENLALHMLGTADTVTYEIGDTLPDDTVTTEQIVVPRITAGTNPLIKGTVKFIGDSDGDERPVLITDVVLTPSGDRSLISDDYTKISFEGAVLADENGVLYEEYLIPLA